MPPPHRPLWSDDAALLPEWLNAASREAICARDPNNPEALVAAGRLLRGGHLPGGARARLEANLGRRGAEAGDDRLRAQIDALFATVETELDHLEEDSTGADLRALLCSRDDLESLSWSAGLAGVIELEEQLLKATATLDRRALDLRDRLSAALRSAPDLPAWLRALSAQTPGAWWSNLLLVSEHREKIVGWLSRPLVGSALARLSLPPSLLEGAPTLHFGGGAESEPETILARPLGAPVATLFEGAVVIHTHGLAEHDREVAPGLVVRHAQGAFETIREVGLDPVGQVLPHRSPLALAWWVPLTGLFAEAPHAPCALRVRLLEGGRLRDERLPLGSITSAG